MVKKALVPVEHIQSQILLIRGEKVLLDEALAKLYGVETRVLVQAVRRNIGRFPEDFMFQLTDEEWNALRSQTRISKSGRGGRRYAPYAFSEQGVAMLSSVLKSKNAVQVNIQIMRAFVMLRRYLASQEQFRRKLAALERKLTEHDAHFRTVFNAIRELMTPPEKSKKQIGFIHDKKKK